MDMLPWVSSPCFLALPILSRMQYSMFTNSVVGSADSQSKAFFRNVWSATTTRLLPYLKEEKKTCKTVTEMINYWGLLRYRKPQKLGIVREFFNSQRKQGNVRKTAKFRGIFLCHAVNISTQFKFTTSLSINTVPTLLLVQPLIPFFSTKW